MGQALEHDAAEIHRGLGATLKGDLHHAALDRGGLVVALDIFASHHVEDTSAPAPGSRPWLAATKSSSL